MEHGIVNSVKFKEGVPFCNVQALRVSTEYRDVPVMCQHRGMFMVPEVDQKVTMLALDDQRFVVGVLARNPDGENPDLSAGELALQLDANSYIKFTKDGNGNYNVDVSASGDVKIDGIDFDKHTHPYVDDEIADTGDGSGSETAQNKTTDPPQ